MRKLAFIVSLLLLAGSLADGQETVYGPGYSAIIALNPAFSGTEGAGKLKLSYLNFYPGNSFNLHSVHASYDSWFQGLHGGAGIWISDDYLGGIINDTRGGVSYAYFLQAGEDLFINAGLSAGMFRRGYSFGDAVLPDMIDPFGGVGMPSETLVSENKIVFDVGAGFLFKYKSFFAGIALNHLSRPDISEGTDQSFLERKLNINVSGEFSLGQNEDLKLRPSGFFETQGGWFLAGVGTSLETERFSLNTLACFNNPGINALQAGFALKAGVMEIYYNYRFNISARQGVIPFSLLHQTGLSVTINNPVKRSSISTITIPDL